MKKNWLYPGISPAVYEMLTKMKLTIFLICITVLGGFAADSYAQTTRLTLDAENATIKSILSKIENQSEFKFFYSSNVDVEQTASISQKNKKVFDILDDLFEGTGIKYEVYGRQIALLDKGENFTFPTETAAQQKAVTGKVTDDSGQPLPGVTVVIKGTTQGTVTNGDGEYTLSGILEDATLVFSFVGMLPQEIPVGDQTTINVDMAVDAIGIEEVVAIGYGTMKKSDITGAVSSVSSKDLGKSNSGNIMQQAQGKLAGVDIISESGIPGSDFKITIRGNRSITASNEPLFVIDGIPTNVGINDFNPNDIEAIEVLKDASAVAIYGSRGANGVILVTTKSGKKGDAKINYSGSYSIKKAFENIDPMNPQEFAEYVRVANGLNRNDTSQDEEILTSVPNLQSGQNPDWFDIGYGNGLLHQHQISVSGGTDKIKYYVSGSYFDEEGIVTNSSDYSKISFRANIEAKATKNLTIGLSAVGTKSTQNVMASSFYTRLIDTSPLAFPYNENGELIPYPNPRVEQINPLYNLDPSQYIDELRGQRIFAGIFAEYKLFESLSYRINYGPDLRSSRRGEYTGILLGEGTNSASVSNRVDNINTLENILTFDEIYGDHSLNILGLFSSQTSRLETSGSSVQNLPVEDAKFYNLGSANDILSVNSFLSEWALLSYMGRINYKYKDKYLLTVSGRADGSSRLAEGNKWSFFPSTALGWIVSEESFFNSNNVNFLKLRVGYGEVGNTAISPYQTKGGLALTDYAFGDAPAFGYALDIISNPDLEWEISKSLNIGLDFTLFDSRVAGAIELYDTKTSNLLLNRFLPITSGYNSVLQNIGSTRNRGLEVSATAYIIQNANDGFNWNADLTFFTNKEEIVSLIDNTNDDVGNQWFIGQPINVFYDFKQLGIWQKDEADEAALYGLAPGDIKIADVNGRDENGNLTKQPDGKIDQDDKTILGSTTPKWSGGITNRFSYKGFDLSIFVYARQGQMLRSSFHNLGGNSWQGRHGSINLNYWTPDNPSNEIPLPIAERRPYFYEAVQYFDASFVKIKNINLGYTFDKEFMNRVGIGLESVRLYSAIDNPDWLTFSEYKIVDPETGTQNVGGANPLTLSSIIFGINVNF